MPIICPKCKNKTALVKGTFYFDADEEPYESGEYLELNLNGEQRIHGHYCEECDVMIEVWDDEREAEHYEKQFDDEESKLRDHFAGLAMQGLASNTEWSRTVNDNWDDYIERMTTGAYEIAERYAQSQTQELIEILQAVSLSPAFEEAKEQYGSSSPNHWTNKVESVILKYQKP